MDLDALAVALADELGLALSATSVVHDLGCATGSKRLLVSWVVRWRSTRASVRMKP